jgi:negative regulator of flagellin synthesis FlgM
MGIYDSLSGLNSSFGVGQADLAALQAKKARASSKSLLEEDQVSSSGAGKAFLDLQNASEVRMDKVARIQAALAAGSYNVPASGVASRLLDSMLAGAQ